MSVLVGDSIAQVWLDPFGVRFLFESQNQMYAETRVVQTEADGTIWPFACVGHNGAPVLFHRLLYRPIVALERQDMQLTFRFDNGAALTVHSEAGPRESGHFILGQTDFIVF